MNAAALSNSAHLPSKWKRLALATDDLGDTTRLRADIASFYAATSVLGRPPPLAVCDSPAQMEVLVRELGAAAAHGCAVLRELAAECRVRQVLPLGDLNATHPLRRCGDLPCSLRQAGRAFTADWCLPSRTFSLAPATDDPDCLEPRWYARGESRLERYIATQFVYREWMLCEALVQCGEFTESGALAALVRIVERVGAFLPAIGLALVCRRPDTLRLRQGSQFHHPREPAIVWRDGYEQHFLMGAYLPPPLFRAATATDADPKKIIEATRDAHRREALAEWFALRALAAGMFRELQRDHYGRLIEVDIAGERRRFVRVVDPAPAVDRARREHDIPVPPECATAHEAVAWSFGLRHSPGELYAPENET